MTTLPAVPDAFRWTRESWGAALRCAPLEQWAPHLFSTRQLPLASQDDEAALAASIGADRLAMLSQVHGAEVITVDDVDRVPGRATRGDALATNQPGVALAVRAADCVPMLMAAPASGIVAAVHAGWRGTAARVAAAAVSTLERRFGCRPSDLVVAIGPSIGVCCYEVGSDLVDAFAAAGHARSVIDRWFVSRPARRGSRERSRLHLDLVAASRDQLVLAGVPEDQIHACGLCTAMHLDVLTSYRAEQSRAGRLVGVIARRST